MKSLDRVAIERVGEAIGSDLSVGAPREVRGDVIVLSRYARQAHFEDPVLLCALGAAAGIVDLALERLRLGIAPAQDDRRTRSAERDRGILPVAFDPDCLRPGHSGAFAIGAFRHRGRLSRSKADFPTSQLSKCTFSLRHSDFLHFAAVPEAAKKRPKGTLAKSRKPLRHSH